MEGNGKYNVDNVASSPLSAGADASFSDHLQPSDCNSMSDGVSDFVDSEQGLSDSEQHSDRSPLPQALSPCYTSCSPAYVHDTAAYSALDSLNDDLVCGESPKSPTDSMCDGIEDLELQAERPALHRGDESLSEDMLSADSDSPRDKFYCICRQPASNVDDRFMICCDQCSDWFHGDCVGITAKRSKNIEKFYCPPCQETNPALIIIYRPTVKRKKHEEKPRKRSSRMCGECEACTRPDCGKCRFCADMRKFGGPNRLRQKCMYRRCLNLSKPISDTQMALDKAWANRNPDSDDEMDYELEKPKKKDRAEREALRAEKEAERARKKAEKAEKKAAKKAAAAAAASQDKPRRGRPAKVKHRQSGSGSFKSHSERIDSYRQIQQCYGPQCTQLSRPSSKYCSDDCGHALAMKRLKRFLPDRCALWTRNPDKTHIALKASISKLQVDESDILERISGLKERSKQLESIIQHTRTLQADSEEELTDPEQDIELDLQIDCVVCGHPTNFRRALQHMERCYSRIEGLMSFSSVFKTKSEGVNIFCDYFSQGQYCKRLRVLCPDHYKGTKVGQDDVCGCPLTPDVFAPTLNYCLEPKRLCQSHVSWERLRQAALDMERLNWLLKLEEVQDQIHILHEQCRASGHILGLLTNATIPHGDGEGLEKFTMLHGFRSEQQLPKAGVPEPGGEVTIVVDVDKSHAGAIDVRPESGQSPASAADVLESCEPGTSIGIAHAPAMLCPSALHAPAQNAVQLQVQADVSNPNHPDVPMEVGTPGQ